MALMKCKACGNEISKKAAACPKCGEKPKRTSIVTWIVGVFILFGMIGHFGGSSTSSSGPSEYQQNLANLSLDFKWNKAGFDNIMQADFTIKNKNTFDVKDIKVLCIHTAPSGTVIDKNDKVIYEVFKAGATKKVNNFNMGFILQQANTSSCSITSFERA